MAAALSSLISGGLHGKRTGRGRQSDCVFSCGSLRKTGVLKTEHLKTSADTALHCSRPLAAKPSEPTSAPIQVGVTTKCLGIPREGRPWQRTNKKDLPRHIHLFELIERHRRFILGCARELNDHRPESSLVGPFAVEDAGAFEPLAGSLVDPATAVDEPGNGARRQCAGSK